MSYELKEEVSFNIDKELWLGNLRFDFYDSKETLCNKFFPSDLIYELDKTGSNIFKEDTRRS